MKLANFLIRNSRKFVIIGLVGSLISAALYTLGIHTLKIYTKAPQEDQLELLLYLILLFCFSGFIAVLISKVITKHFEVKMANLRSEFASKILEANFERAENNRSKFVPVLVQDIIEIGWYAKTIPDALVAIFQVIGVLGYLTTISWEVTASFLIMFLVSFSIIFMVFPTIYRTEKEFGRIRNILFETIEALGSGLKDLSLNPIHSKWFSENVLKPSGRNNAEIVTKLNTLDIGLTKSLETLILTALASVIFILNRFSNYNNEEFFTFLTVMLFILPALIRLSTFFKRQKKAEVALERMETLNIRFNENVNLVKNKPLTIDFTSENKLLSLNNVKYTYTESDQKFIVGPFDLAISANEILLIRGGNGSGKTTLAKVLTGLYLPQEGALKFCGQSVNEETLTEFRSQFSAVFTDSYVFGDLGYLKNASKDKAQSLLQDLDLQEKVNIENWTISNTKLSFGQMGRLSLFRSILEDKPIMLLDEWAANQDPHFKEKFYLEIVPKLKEKGKTVILISHDDHYYHVADRIVKMRAGSIDEITIPSR